MLGNVSLAKKGLFLVTVFLVAELLLLFSLTVLIKESRQQALEEAEAKEFGGKLCEVLRSISETVTTLQDYHSSGGKAISDAKVRERLDGLNPKLAALEDFMKREPEYQQRLGRLLRVLKAVLKIVNKIMSIDKADTGKQLGWAAAAAKLEKIDIESTVEKQVGDLLSDLRDKQQRTTKQQEQLRRWIELLLFVAVALDVVFAVMLARAFVSRITSRLAVLSANTKLLVERKALPAPMTEKDEIGFLDQSFREMAEALDEARRKQQAIVENASDVICSVNDAGRFLKASPACASVLGYQPEELTQLSFAEIVAEEERDQAQLHLRNFVSGSEHEFEAKVRKKDGSLIHTLWSGRWSSEDKQIFCVGHDITARKLAQERLRASELRVRSILDNMLVGLLITTTDGVIESRNARFDQMVGDNSNDVLGRQVLDLFPSVRQEGGDSYAEKLAGGLGKVVERELKRTDGGSVPVEISLTDFDNVDGHRVLVNVIDVSERKQIEQVKQQFVAMISHDLRTPLTAINGFLELLADSVYGEISSKGSAKAEKAMGDVERLLRLINDLLDITKLEARKMELQSDRISLKRLVARAATTVQPMAKQRFVRLLQDVPDTMVTVDAARLSRALENLIANAIKSSKMGGDVTVSATMEDAQFEIRIADQGKGLTPEDCATVFDRFRKAGEGEEKKGGLGLAISKATVEAHSGKIGVESELGKGSTYWLRIPQSNGGAA